MSKGISLDKYARGALHDLFNREMQVVSANIWNPNTSATAKRKITVVVELSPDEGRQLAVTDISVKSTLCPVKGVRTKMLLGYNTVTKEGEYSEFNAEMLGQVDMEDLEALAKENQEAREGKVIDLRKENI